MIFRMTRPFTIRVNLNWMNLVQSTRKFNFNKVYSSSFYSTRITDLNRKKPTHAKIHQVVDSKYNSSATYFVMVSIMNLCKKHHEATLIQN